ncbi:uncharacterized protein LAESUDRAFT_808371 [Laetiporus sulphureus 93-53]|uniref:Uncharacterized protein n=1 Tax=Laetiporus sulphureus 93-53 TaxID=1314785 RepID=A0A165IBF5_9APHY|nr:uncharacterized protein LAESUDRAFT_808371 [Laetiporus sulphureus 93-53]KZT12846.1 hypothetical protein LAESUDRAFT_808371 [Laetiporus sulphureus 93-53]
MTDITNNLMGAGGVVQIRVKGIINSENAIEDGSGRTSTENWKRPERPRLAMECSAPPATSCSSWAAALSVQTGAGDGELVMTPQRRERCVGTSRQVPGPPPHSSDAMRAVLHVLPFLVPALAAALVGAAPPTNDLHALTDASTPLSPSVDEILFRRDEHDEHSHSHNAKPLEELNETQITLHHQPTLPSYWTIDLVDKVPGEHRYPGLMAAHALFMGFAFFGALPAGIALRSVKSAWHSLTVILFYAFVVLGLGSSMLYRKLTPDMYEGAAHASQGYGWLAFAVLLSTLDVVAMVVRLITYVRSIQQGEEKFGFKSSWSYIVLGREEGRLGVSAEYTGLVADEEELNDAELKVNDVESVEADSEPLHERRNRPMQPIRTVFDVDEAAHGHDGDTETAEWANDVRRHRREPSYPQSAASERTLYGPHSPRRSNDTLADLANGSWLAGLNKRTLLRNMGRVAFATSERVLVFAGFMQVTTGIVTYTGGCRQNYINGCLAHLIKGGIFWCYGLATFARYLGSFSSLGWAWNRPVLSNVPSAEFVESLVIFAYGATNTWMERFGAKPGDPYTAKQVQHIGIAVMFWFAGLVGMGIESKRIRRWLAGGSTAAVSTSNEGQEAVAEPPSYSASFNPFPALCIGITGAAMSAHAQTYVFQVQIHMLWGYLLSAFAVFRCLTYFFLWMAPPRSILPSRPPTEALGAFFLACGGLSFMFSTEELTIAAMRQGRDDVMMFLNVAVAITCLAFCWTLAVVGFKGWLKSRTHGAMQFHPSA